MGKEGFLPTMDTNKNTDKLKDRPIMGIGFDFDKKNKHKKSKKDDKSEKDKTKNKDKKKKKVKVKYKDDKPKKFKIAESKFGAKVLKTLRSEELKENFKRDKVLLDQKEFWTKD